MRDINDARYDQFTPQERFSLTMSALARNDIRESDRLWDSCPRYNYKAIDFDYSNRVMAINIITLVFFQKCVYQYNMIKLTETYLLLIARNDSPNWEDQEKAFDKRDIHIAHLKALYEALNQFCIHVGINSNDFLSTVPDHVLFDIDKYLSSVIEPSDEDIERTKNFFLEHWQF